MANPKHLAKLREGVSEWNRWRQQNPHTKINLTQAKLRGFKMVGANLNAVDLSGAILANADLSHANLAHSDLRRANLGYADIVKAELGGADLRSANLQHANLDGSSASDIKLWETQRAGWSIRDIHCEGALWDEEAKQLTTYSAGEFEKLHSAQTSIELFYEDGLRTFELNTLPALMHHLASLHPGTNIRLRSIEEVSGGSKLFIAVDGGESTQTEKIIADTIQVYQAQIALRDKDNQRLAIQKDYIESFFLGKLIPAMLTAATPQNVFEGPVTGVVIAGRESKVDFHQTVNENSALLPLLEKLMSRYADLDLSGSDAAKFQSELQTATTEIEKKAPDKSILSKSVNLLQKLATEAITKAAGKLGESAVTDWQTWLHQLGQFVHQLK